MGQKFEFLTISSLYVPYISATAKNRGLHAAYVAFYPPCRNPVKSVPRGKAIWNANGEFVSVLLTHLFTCILEPWALQQCSANAHALAVMYFTYLPNILVVIY